MDSLKNKSAPPQSASKTTQPKSSNGIVSVALAIIGTLSALGLPAGIAISKIDFHSDIFFSISLKIVHLFRPRKEFVVQMEEGSKVGTKESIERMVNNAVKAIEEHVEKDLVTSRNPYATLDEVMDSLECNNTEINVNDCVSDSAAEIGPRTTMEDAHFVKTYPEENALLAGVFDGHGGDEVAKLASEHFEKQFSTNLKDCEGDILKAFERTIDQVQEKVKNMGDLNKIGSTAVVSYMDLSRKRIYTATLGDSEANIYREIGEEMKSIPLSCVRDWDSTKDKERVDNSNLKKAVKFVDNDSQHKQKTRYKNINISRAIGDIQFDKAIIQKPKVTVQELKKGDTIILACDGLKDYVSESKIVEITGKESTPSWDRSSSTKKGGGTSIASHLTTEAVNNMSPGVGGDNVTVVSITLN